MRRSGSKGSRALVAGLTAALVIATMFTGAAGCSKAKPPGAGTRPGSESEGGSRSTTEFLPFPAEQPGTAAPKPPQGTAERPALVSVRVGIGENDEDGGVSIGTAMFYESARAIVGTSQFVLHATFEPIPSADWFKKNVSVEGGNARIFEEDYAQGWAQYIVPEGPEGETVTLRIRSATLVGGADSFELVLKRVDEPRAVLEVAENGGWRKVVAGDVLRARPLKLRVTFTKEMDKATVEPAFKELGGKLEWAGGKAVTWTGEEPPEAVRIDVNAARSTDGLWVLGGLPVVYTGQEPRLWAFDPASGEDKGLAAVPTNLSYGRVSPDGTRLLAGAYAASTSRLSPGPVVWRIVDLAGGGATRLPDGGGYVGWAGSESVVWLADKRCGLVDLSGRKTKEWAHPYDYHFRFPTVSPDGKWLAGLVPDFESGAARDPENSLVPNDLVLISLESGKVDVVKEFVRVYLPPMDWFVRAGPAWSADSKLLAALGDRGPGGEVRVYDLATGAAHTATVIDGPKYVTVEPFSWSADGEYWVINGRAVEANLEAVTMPAASEPQPTWNWSPDGQWVTSYAEDGNWGKVNVRGAVGPAFQDRGERDGFFCGWDNQGLAYYVKWADVDSGYRPMEP